MGRAQFRLAHSLSITPADSRSEMHSVVRILMRKLSWSPDASNSLPYLSVTLNPGHKTKVTMLPFAFVLLGCWIADLKAKAGSFRPGRNRKAISQYWRAYRGQSSGTKCSSPISCGLPKALLRVACLCIRVTLIGDPCALPRTPSARRSRLELIHPAGNRVPRLLPNRRRSDRTLTCRHTPAAMAAHVSQGIIIHCR